MKAESTTLQCGHEVPIFGQTVSIPGVGSVCRACHTPVPLEAWDETLRSRTYRYVDGKATHYTRLLGLDPVGRALYYDTKQGQVLQVVPKHHPDFEQDVEPGASPLRKYPPRHGPGRSALINGPNNDVLVAVGRYDAADVTPFVTGSLAEWVVKHARVERWQAIHPSVLEEIEEAVEHYDRDRYVAGAFPVEQAREVLAAFRQ